MPKRNRGQLSVLSYQFSVSSITFGCQQSEISSQLSAIFGGDAVPDESEIVEVDARGLLCPLPVLRLAKAIDASPAWKRAILLATDPDARADVEAFCLARGLRLARAVAGTILEFEIERPVEASEPKTETEN
jgi:tRNA 2-thiouridine synthesizing protein A